MSVERTAVHLFLARHRRLCAAAFAGVATACALAVLRPPAPSSTKVLAAARDLPAGTVLTTRDVRVIALPAAVAPAGALAADRSTRRLTGRMLSGPMRRGEPLTDARLLGAGLLKGYGDGIVAAPVRLADAGITRLLRPGDRVDVLVINEPYGERSAGVSDPGGSAPQPPAEVRGDPTGDDRTAAAAAAAAEGPMPSPPGGRVRLVASRLPVVTIPRPHPDGEVQEGALIVLATDRAQAAALAGAQGRLTITIVT